MQLSRRINQHLSGLQRDPTSACSSSPSSSFRILDICSGGGCIAITLALEAAARRQRKAPWSVQVISTGIDVLPEAVQLARENVELAQSQFDTQDRSPTSPSIQFHQVDLFSDAAVSRFLDDSTMVADTHSQQRRSPFDLIVSNPPYIPLQEWEALDRSVKDHESPLALVGQYPISSQATTTDADTGDSTQEQRGHENASKSRFGEEAATRGLDFYHRIHQLLPSLLAVKPEHSKVGAPSSSRATMGLDDDDAAALLPLIVLEIGHDQGAEVKRIFEKDGTYRCQVRKDQFDRDRTVWVYKR